MGNRMGGQEGRWVVFRIREWMERQRREWVDAGWGLATETTEEGCSGLWVGDRRRRIRYSLVCSKIRDLGQETQGLIKTSRLRKKRAGIGAESGGASPESQLLMQLRQEDSKFGASQGYVEGLDSESGSPNSVMASLILPQWLVQGERKILRWGQTETLVWCLIYSMY